MRLTDLPGSRHAELPGELNFMFTVHVQSICDELDLTYDVLEPSGWTFRRLPDGRWWASHPAGGNSEYWKGWKWHGDSTSWIGSGL